jgi:hypothetical protein
MSIVSHSGRRLAGICLAALAASALVARTARAVGPVHSGVRALSGDVTGTVTDSTSGQPLSSAEISVTREGRIVANTNTDQLGRFTIHNLSAGSYAVAVHYIGFRAASRSITLGDNAPTVAINFALTPVALNLQAVEVTTTASIAVNTRTGDQVFKQNDYHGAPTNTTSQILQQAIAGSVRAPTGEVHIRGQHAEYTYYIDGVPVPAGISGSLNELFDPSVVDQISFQTGGWDAEYGNKNTAVVNVSTRIPPGRFHADLGSYGGSYGSAVQGPKAFDGQSLALSSSSGPWGFFFSGARQQSDMRREPIVFDTATNRAVNFHNDGRDLFGFVKVQYAPSTRDVFSLDLNDSQTTFSVPYDSTSQVDTSGAVTPVVLNDNQRDRNAFVNLGWRHLSGAGAAPTEFFFAGFYRYGSLDFTPGTTDTPSFVFFPDTTNPYNLRENRNFTTLGVKADVTYHATEDLELRAGTISSFTRGHEDFASTDATGAAGPSSNSSLTGSDVGAYAQAAYSPVEWFELRTGIRHDAHLAPFAGTQAQWSPRLRLNFFPSPATTLYVYFGRLFLPTNVEDLRAITSSALGPVASPLPTLPERDDFYEAGLIRRFPNGIVGKVSAYRKRSVPGIDDNTVPGSAIVTSVNIAHATITGIETVLEVRPPGPLSGYLNLAINHAYGSGPITGGFFPTDAPQGFFDLDHDQRISSVASVVYSPGRLFVNATEIFGSGLTNGVDPADCACSYGTGLFALNKGTKVSGNAITNLSAGYTFFAGRTLLRPQLYIENVFDKQYLLKGAFFSGASLGRPRSIQLRMNVGI